MKCILCKEGSGASRSVEHVMPESLGNKEHILPPGWVCDRCNNYLSIKVEAPFLNSWWGRVARFGMGVENKKGNIPIGEAVHLKTRTRLDINVHGNSTIVIPSSGENSTQWEQYLADNSHGTIISPIADLPPLEYDTARFIAKVAIEVLALKLLDTPGANEELVNQVALDSIRDYVRRGKPGFVWPVSMRRIYPGNFAFVDEFKVEYEVLHEWDVLPITSEGIEGVELIAVIAIFGVEFAINLGGPDLHSYEEWLMRNDGVSYLYSKSRTEVVLPEKFLNSGCPPML
ncbi:HNH endonuclease [Prosthecobacter sp.]|uniref:HNH endonuclease n=1 Tax=Prosthecobacter sp. TaxID=1965333 RepID=UPI0037834417